jgi:nitrogen fixation protein NifB
VAVRQNTRRRFGEPATPGRALGVKDVVQWLDRVLADGVTLMGAGVSGPGEPLAEPAVVLETIRSVRAKHAELPLFLVTNGLCSQDADIAALAGELAAAGLSRVIVNLDAVDPMLVEQIFAWIRPGRRTVPLPEAAPLFVDAQAKAIRAFREAGLVVVARMTVFPGINEHHVEDVANAAAALGADIFDLAPCPSQPAPASCAPAPSSACSPSACSTCGSAKSCSSASAAPSVEDNGPAPLAELAPGRLQELKAAAARYLRLASEADSCGDIRWMEQAGDAAVSPDGPGIPKPSGARVNVAVASSGGLDVDLHLGQAIRFLIFGPRAEDGLPCLLETREAPEPGGGDQRWIDLSNTLHDCFAILAASAGAHPREVLAGLGVTVLTTETDVQAAVDVLYGGGKKQGKKRVKVD